MLQVSAQRSDQGPWNELSLSYTQSPTRRIRQGRVWQPSYKNCCCWDQICLNCTGSFTTTNKTFISFISLIYFPWFKPLVCARTLEEIIAVHLKRAFPSAVPWQFSNIQTSILKPQHKEPTCLWVPLLNFAIRENFFWKLLTFKHEQFRMF